MIENQMAKNIAYGMGAGFILVVYRFSGGAAQNPSDDQVVL